MRAILPIALLACLALTGCQNNARLAPEGDDMATASGTTNSFGARNAPPSAEAVLVSVDAGRSPRNP